MFYGYWGCIFRLRFNIDIIKYNRNRIFFTGCSTIYCDFAISRNYISFSILSISNSYTISLYL